MQRKDWGIDVLFMAVFLLFVVAIGSYRAGMNDCSKDVRMRTMRSAEIEAERLARANPGARFIVLESVKFATVEDPVKWHDTDDVPF